MARRSKADAEKTRRKILNAALDLFVEKGYERTTFEDVAGRIGLSKGAVYWHFSSKPDLLSELVANMAALHAEELGRMLSEPASLSELRDHFVRRAELVVSKTRNRKVFKMMTRLDWSAARFAPVKQRLQQLENGVFSVIDRTLRRVLATGGIRADVDVSLVTTILGTLWLGLVKAQTDRCLAGDLKQAVTIGFDMVIAAVRPVA